MTILLYFFMYAAVILFGSTITGMMGFRNFQARISLGTLIGTGLLTYLQMLLFGLFHIRFTTINLVILLLACWAIGIFYLKREKSKGKTSFWKLREFKKYFQQLHLSIYEKIILIFLIILIAFRFISNYYWPIVDWDAIALYDFRAKVFSLTGDMADGVRRGYFLHYPLYTSLLHTWNYLLGIPQAKTWYAVLFAAFIGCFYYLLRRKTSRLVALFGCLFLAVNQTVLIHAAMAYTNLPYAIFLGIGYLLLLMWIVDGTRRDLLAGVSLIALSTWIRITEPFWLMSLPLLCIGFIKWKKDLVYILACIGCILFLKYPWMVLAAHLTNQKPANPFLTYYVASTDPITVSILLQRVQDVFLFFFNSVFPIFRMYVLPLAISLGYAVYKKNTVQLFNFLILFAFIGFIMAGIFLFSFQFPGWAEIPDSALRMSIFLLPLIIYVLLTSDLWKLKKE